MAWARSQHALNSPTWLNTQLRAVGCQYSIRLFAGQADTRRLPMLQSVTPRRQTRLNKKLQPYPDRCVCRYRTFEPGAIPGQTSHREAGCSRGSAGGWADPVGASDPSERPGWHSPLSRLLQVTAGNARDRRGDTAGRYDGSRRRLLVRLLLLPRLPDPGLPSAISPP